MNLESGFKRITLIISIIVGTGTWCLVSKIFFNDWNQKRTEYHKQEDKYNNIIAFWQIWDANVYAKNKKEIIISLLTHCEIELNTGDKIVSLSTDEIFPIEFAVDIIDKFAYQRKGNLSICLEHYMTEKEKRNMVLASRFGYSNTRRLEYIILNTPQQTLNKIAQNAKEKALLEAGFNKWTHKGFWAKKIPLEITLSSIIVGIPIGGLSFTAIWFLFLLLKWVGYGFFQEENNHRELPER